MPVDDERAEGTPGKKLSRSALLAGGGAAAAGLALGQARSAAGGVASAGVEGDAFAAAAKHQNALELVFKVDQAGGRFTTYGYVTQVASLPDHSLFSGSSRNERAAYFTIYSEATLQDRSILEAVHALDVVGPLGLYLRRRPGATFADPKSFKQGTLVAAYDGEFQSIVTVTAPRQGIESLTGALRQTKVERFTFAGGSRILGKVGLRLRVDATGSGKLLDPKQPKAVLVLAGTVVVP